MQRFTLWSKGRRRDSSEPACVISDMALQFSPRPVLGIWLPPFTDKPLIDQYFRTIADTITLVNHREGGSLKIAPSRRIYPQRTRIPGFRYFPDDFLECAGPHGVTFRFSTEAASTFIVRESGAVVKELGMPSHWISAPSSGLPARGARKVQDHLRLPGVGDTHRQVARMAGRPGINQGSLEFRHGRPFQLRFKELRTTRRRELLANTGPTEPAVETRAGTRHPSLPPFRWRS